VVAGVALLPGGQERMPFAVGAPDRDPGVRIPVVEGVAGSLKELLIDRGHRQLGAPSTAASA